MNRVLEPLDGMRTWPVPLKGSAFDWAVSSLMDTYTEYFRRKIQRTFFAGRVSDQRGEPGRVNFKMRAVSRHKSIDVLSSYVRDADAFTDHAGNGLL